MSDEKTESMNLLVRLQVLDGQLRSFKRAATIFLLIVGVVLLLLSVRVIQAASEPGKSFVLRDSNGKARAALTLIKEAPVLEFYDENEKLLGGIKMADDDKGLLLMDGKGARAVLNLDKEGPRLTLRDEQGKGRASLKLTADAVGLILADVNGTLRAGLTVDKTGPHLILRDDKGETLFSKP